MISNLKPDYLIHFGSSNPSFLEKTINKRKFNYENKKNTLNLIQSIINKSPKTIFIFANTSQIFNFKKKKVNEKSKISKTSYYTSFRIDILKYMLDLKKKFKFKFINLILFNHDSIYRNKKFLLPKIVQSIKQNNYKFLEQIYQRE